MAAPASKTIRTLDGKWQINKALSNPTDPVLALQGIGWLTRKAIGLATVTQHLRTYSAPPDEDANAEAVSHIDFDQTATGGIKGTTEKRSLDWKLRPHSDYLFGDLMAKSRWSSIRTILEENVGTGKEAWQEEDAKFLCEGWLEESKEGEVVESWVRNEKAGWTGWQVWGFVEVEVNGKMERWFARRFVIRKGDKAERIRLVYSWEGENVN